MNAVDGLIQNAFDKHPLSDDEIQAIAVQVATTGFDPKRLVNAPREIAGLIWQGRPVAAGQRIEVKVAHYLKHVVLQQEWPVGTTLAQYEADAARATQDPSSGVFISSWQGNRNIGVISYSAMARGPQGSGWILVEYRVVGRHWATVFQPDDGPYYVSLPGRTGLIWLRPPS